jgi:hypothetical protein
MDTYRGFCSEWRSEDQAVEERERMSVRARAGAEIVDLPFVICQFGDLIFENFSIMHGELNAPVR